ncbi:MAG: TetR/AcrR family transcriptional regulator [Planctomycetes bacterium]|nr:TetR/AcrR family transcriptional regulator [Planctomycetota bacterium]
MGLARRTRQTGIGSSAGRDAGMDSPRRRLPGTQRREQLLSCALEQFCRHGYARSTTSELARAAGVTEPVIYRHFESKKHLFVELIRRTGEKTIRTWEEALAGAEDPAQRLLRLLGENPMVTGEMRQTYRVIFQAVAETDDPDIRRVVAEHVHRLHTFLVRELTLAREQHKIAGRFSPEIIAWLLINTGLGYGMLDALGVPGHGADGSGAQSKDVIARLLLGRASEGDGVQA